jgi:hypothetical protein
VVKATARKIHIFSRRTRLLIGSLAQPPAMRRMQDFSGGQTVVLFLLLILFASIPIWTNPLPPLSDYVNHLGRMHVIASGANDANLARYYDIQWQIVPNLMMDLIVPPLARVMNVYLAGQVFQALIFAVIISGTLALNRALFGRWSILPLIAIPLLYNHIFLLGFTNYLFGIGLALWALAAWVHLRDGAWPARYATSVVFVVALFFCHLFAVGLFGLGLLGYEIWRLYLGRGAPWRTALPRFVSAGLPFLAALPLLFASPTLKLATESYWEPRGKIDGLIYVVEVYSDVIAFALTGLVAAGAAWAIRHRLMRIHPAAVVIAAVGGIVYLVMPRVLFASYTADQRLPIALAFMLIATLDMKISHRIVRRGFVALLLTVIAVRVIEVDVSWGSLATTTREFRSSVKKIQPGAKVLVAYADNASGDDVNDLGLVHAACIAMIERAALVSTAFTVQGKQILKVRPTYRSLVDTEDGSPPSISQLLVEANAPAAGATDYWRKWNANYDYVYVLFTGEDFVNPDEKRLTLVQDAERFKLFRIKK